MSKKTIWVKKEVFVCDQCGEESDYNSLKVCDDCGREICPKCSIYYTFHFTRWEGGRGTGSPYYISGMHQEGMQSTKCLECANRFEPALVKLGFKSFTFNIQAV